MVKQDVCKSGAFSACRRGFDCGVACRVQVMVMLLQSFVSSLTVVLPFYPVGTMERVVQVRAKALQSSRISL
jgi:hypothetical protein